VTEETKPGTGDAGRAIPILARVLLVVGFLYLFLVGVSLLEAGIAALGGGFQERLLREISHPISGLCAGILLTVLVQSSSVSTSTIVGMVGSGAIPINLAVPMIMGANIGTTVTSTVASLGSIRRPGEFRLAFAAATVHDFFNLVSVLVLFPLELTTRFLSRSAGWLTEILIGAEVTAGERASSPIREAVRLPVGWIESVVEPGPFTGILILAIGLALIFLSLASITRNMRQLVAGGVERAMNRIIGHGGGAIGILVGIGVTIAVQSSSITTSILVPLVASGILSVRTAYPITVGANVGTTITALIASLAVVRPEGLTIALVHSLFNIVAMTIIFPIPRFRLIPVHLAEWLAGVAVKRHTIVLLYGAGVFIVLPLAGVFLIR
jgi:solute carrier family 34 (sodium-dependent phosphate cotransporter)